MIGQSATISGRVAGAEYRPDVNGQPTFLNIGNDHPDPTRFTAVIWGEDRKNFRSLPEVQFLDETICVEGVVYENERDGVPQIKVVTPDQIYVNFKY